MTTEQKQVNSITEKPKTELAVNAIKSKGMDIKYATDGTTELALNAIKSKGMDIKYATDGTTEVDLKAVNSILYGRDLNPPKMSKLQKFMCRYKRHINVFITAVSIAAIGGLLYAFGFFYL